MRNLITILMLALTLASCNNQSDPGNMIGSPIEEWKQANPGYEMDAGFEYTIKRRDIVDGNLVDVEELVWQNDEGEVILYSIEETGDAEMLNKSHENIVNHYKSIVGEGKTYNDTDDRNKLIRHWFGYVEIDGKLVEYRVVRTLYLKDRRPTGRATLRYYVVRNCWC